MVITVPSSRRSFLKTSAVAAGAAVANPLGLFSPRSAFGSIPTGEYLRQMTDDQFWFHRLLQEKNEPAIANENAQLSIRLGKSGGFAVGYFSTIGFLSAYKEQMPEDYRDLLLNAARLPESPSRRMQIAGLLENHRRFAEIPSTARSFAPDWKTLNLPALASASKARTAAVPSSKPVKALDAHSKAIALNSPVAEWLKPQSLVRPLEDVNADKLNEVSATALAPTRLAFAEPLIMTSTSWDDASKAVQDQLQKEFDQVNQRFENRKGSVDPSPVVTFKDGKLDYSWLDHTLYPAAFQDGITSGRLAALAYVAMVEAGILLKPSIATGTSTAEHLDKQVLKFGDASRLERCFGTDEFWQHGLDVGAFRPAVRLKTICYVTDKDLHSRRVELMTPFLPYEVGKRLDAQMDKLQTDTNRSICSAVKNYFADTSLSRLDMPITTQALTDATFEGCGEVMRHTNRLLKTTGESFEPLRGSKLISVTMIPEVTSTWTFAGVGGALFSAYLTGLRDQEKLGTEEERLKFKWSINRSVDDLLKRSVNSDSSLAESSATVPAMMQYASGFRTANLVAEVISDKIAQGQGARLVYDNLVKAIPEFFKPLPIDKFLSAEDIASGVLTIASAVRIEVEALRLRVKALTEELEQYKKFNEELTGLIAQLSGELAGVKNQKDLEDFQKSANSLITTMNRNLNNAQKATVAGLQGMLNTFVQVNTTIVTTVTADIKASARVNVQMCSVGTQK